MPPRVGKTTLLMFFLTWIAGKYPEISNLYSAYSDVITSAMFEGVLEVLQDSTTYTWHEIFPETKLVHTDAKDETLDFGRRKRYPTITCRSLYGTLNGACDCQGYLISDDLIGGIEEALNKDRLTSAWYKVDNNLIPRAKENAKILWLGTRWSIVDPAGKRMDLLMNSPEYKHRRFKILSMPALDPLTDESNFDYKFGVGFSTAFYRQRRASFERQDDMASWFAQYQNEPIERDGALFSPGNMKFYNGVLPEEEPDTVRMACDVAFGGGDFLSAPVAYVYGNDVYIADVVFDSSDKKITQPLVVDAICRNKVKKAQFEANNGGDEYANTSVVDWVGNAASAVGNAASSAVSSAVDWVGNAASTVGNAVSSVASTVGNAVSDAADWVGNAASTVADAVSTGAKVAGVVGKVIWDNSAVGTVVNGAVDLVSDIGKGIKNGASSVGDWVGSTSTSIASGIASLGTSLVSWIPFLADGAYDVPTGQLFVAREAGAEMVGSIGGRTTVANNEQIVEAIKQGVIEAMESSSQGGDWTINIVDDDGNIKASQVITAAQRKNRRDGKTVIQLGV